MLLIAALFTSYILQQKRIQAVHETVISIFAGRSQRVSQPITVADSSPRHGGWLDHPHNAWHSYPRHRQLRLPVLLQSPPTSDHPSLGVRITSGQSVEQEAVVELKPRLNKSAGELFPQYRNHLDLCICWNVYLCRLARLNPMAVDENTI
jgi:hypothetical protein